MLQIIPQCQSTNSELARLAPGLAHGDALMALEQTAGRGQRGNSWEAAPGLNITLSILLMPGELPAVRQFEISEAVALGVADLLIELGVSRVAVKWPNDVYVADRKIAGILIENSLTPRSTIARSIAGIGLNVNQTEFLSPAPNPVSLSQITGRHYVDLPALGRRMVELVVGRLGRDNHSDYRALLWRGQGLWPWIDAATGREFSASVVDVLPTGHLCLSGCPRPFAFKEVRPAGFVN